MFTSLSSSLSMLIFQFDLMVSRIDQFSESFSFHLNASKEMYSLPFFKIQLGRSGYEFYSCCLQRMTSVGKDMINVWEGGKVKFTHGCSAHISKSWYISIHNLRGVNFHLIQIPGCGMGVLKSHVKMYQLQTTGFKGELERIRTRVISWRKLAENQ